MNTLDHAKRQWRTLEYGMFLHFGVNTFAGQGWGDGKFPAQNFVPSRLDPAQWAEVAVEAGMKYAVLTAKHHDGFCLWDTAYSEYSVMRSPLRRDVVREYVDAFRAAGLKVGLYYSLWDRNCPCYEDDDRYAAYMKNQLAELLENYGDILELWFDGGWDKDSPNHSWADFSPGNSTGARWHWRELYDHIHAIQPNCLVIQNSSSNFPGQIKYPPQDICTAEQFHFVFRGKLCEPPPPAELPLPLEFCATLVPDWFYSEKQNYFHPAIETISAWRAAAVACRGNLLLNVAPDKSGRIPELHRHFLVEANRFFQKDRTAFKIAE